MLTYILFLLWFPLLIKWADMLVSWASSLALKYGIPSLVVGLTVVAFGTSAPELAVNIFSALKGSAELVIGNVIGSNISNILLILWVSACIISLPAEKSTLNREIPFSLFAALLVLWAWIFFWAITFFVSLILLTWFVWFLYYTLRLAKSWKLNLAPDESQQQHSIYSSVFSIIIWLIWLVLWWKWIVDGATQIALSLGMSELIIGLTIVAVWTSLPELATSVIAALKKETDIAIGNIIGSNIFNILLVLWVSWLISPIWINSDMYRDIGVNIWATLLLILFLYFSQGRKLLRIHGIIFIFLFSTYIGYLLYVSLYQ